MDGWLGGRGTINEQTRYHMNLTTHIFLERPTSGRDVLKPIQENIISLQDEVRKAFGWSLDADEDSAHEMAKAFSIESPYSSVCIFILQSKTKTILSSFHSHITRRTLLKSWLYIDGSSSTRSSIFTTNLYHTYSGSKQAWASLYIHGINITDWVVHK